MHRSLLPLAALLVLAPLPRPAPVPPAPVPPAAVRVSAALPAPVLPLGDDPRGGGGMG